MSVFGPNQVEELIIGAAVATETTAPTFIASASDKEIKVLSSDGSAPAAGEMFKILQKTAGTNGLNYEFSDNLKPSKVKKVIVAEYSPEVQKSVRITGFDGNVVADTTYAVEIRLFNDGGTLSPENFATITGYYVTGSSVTGVTAAIIRDGIVASLNNNLTRRGGSEFVITTPNATETDILITGAVQNVVAGKIVGKQIEFEATGKTFPTGSLTAENTATLTSTVVTQNDPGVGTGKYAVNLEWFTKGFKYSVYRDVAYPHNFATPYYASAGTNYNAIHIKYFDDRDNPSVEVQNKVLTILVERTTLASNSNTNDVLVDLRTVLGSENVPANLAVV